MSKNPKLNGIILVSFEYPPRRLSKLSDSVGKLSLFLSKNKIKTWVITFDDWRSGEEKISNYLTINRIPCNVPNNISELAMIMNLKVAYQAAIASIIHSEKIDLIHFFDWMTLPAIISWKGELQQKLVYSTLSTQITRDKTTNPYNSGIQKLEQMGLEAVNLITVNSKKLVQRLTSDYKIPEKNIHQLALTSKKSFEELFEKYKEKI